MYFQEKCDLCGDCFVNCQWIEVEKEQAIAWMEQLRDGKHAEVLDKCITCYACNETCPNDANPFDLIAELQDKYHTPVTEDAVNQMEEHYQFSGELKGIPNYCI